MTCEPRHDTRIPSAHPDDVAILNREWTLAVRYRTDTAQSLAVGLLAATIEEAVAGVGVLASDACPSCATVSERDEHARRVSAGIEAAGLRRALAQLDAAREERRISIGGDE